MKNISHNQKVRCIQIITHLISLIGLFYITIDYLYLSVITYWIIGVLGINVGYHRLLSHRSFDTHKPLEYFLAFIGNMTAVGSPIAWCAVHRHHHGTAETENDPHSPYQIGWFRAWFGLWDIKRINPKMVKDLRKDSFYRFLHKNYLTIHILYAIILTLINPMFLVFLYALPCVLILHSTSAIIVIAHIHGYKTYECKDESRNSWIASLITLGEGWHNNHHANSKDWNNQHKWWELDPNAWIIRAIKK